MYKDKDKDKDAFIGQQELVIPSFVWWIYTDGCTHIN